MDQTKIKSNFHLSQIFSQLKCCQTSLPHYGITYPMVHAAFFQCFLMLLLLLEGTIYHSEQDIAHYNYYTIWVLIYVIWDRNAIRYIYFGIPNSHNIGRICLHLVCQLVEEHTCIFKPYLMQRRTCHNGLKLGKNTISKVCFTSKIF